MSKKTNTVIIVMYKCNVYKYRNKELLLCARVRRVKHLSWRNGYALGWKAVKWSEVLSQCELESHRKMCVLRTRALFYNIKSEVVVKYVLK
jgi:hypothetical protein